MRSCQGSYFQQLWAYFLKTSTCTPRSVVRLVNIFIFLTYCGGLWCSMPFFNNISVISQFYWWRKPENPEQTTNLPEVSDKLYHIMLYRLRLTWVGFKLTTLVVISTNCIIGSCKSNYHMITTTMAPVLHMIQWSKMNERLHDMTPNIVRC